MYLPFCAITRHKINNYLGKTTKKFVYSGKCTIFAAETMQSTVEYASYSYGY